MISYGFLKGEKWDAAQFFFDEYKLREWSLMFTFGISNFKQFAFA